MSSYLKVLWNNFKTRRKIMLLELYCIQIQVRRFAKQFFIAFIFIINANLFSNYRIPQMLSDYEKDYVNYCAEEYPSKSTEDCLLPVSSMAKKLQSHITKA